jgi:sigma-B regulation protein RsbU (phosphoserine phosphatase)
VAAVSKPSQTVDGDFYDFIRWRDASLDVLVGDVMGKGIAAALLGAATKSAFLRAMAGLSADKGGGAGAILESVHRDMVPDLLRLESFVSLCYARFDLNARTVEFVDCGHPRTIHYRRTTGAWEFLEGGSLPLGFAATADYEPTTVPFGPGDLFLFYSDGIPEAQDAEGRFFGAERLAHVIADNAGLSAREILCAVEQSVILFTGTEHLGDDFTCVIVEIGADLPVEMVWSEWKSSVENTPAVRDWVVGHVRRVFAKVNDDLAYWCVELAAAETFTNIVEHSYHSDDTRLVRLELQFYPERLVMRFVHWGDGFDPDQVAPPSFDGTRERGFGVFLVANTMDSVKYQHDAAIGQIITMEKQFPAVTE